MLKKLAGVVLAFILTVSFAGCGGNSEEPGAEEGTSGTGSGYSGQEYTLKLAHHLNDTHTASEFAQEFADLVEEESGGKIKIELYGNSQLGNQSENAEAVRMGTIDMCLNDFPTLATVYPKADVVALPYVFQDWENVEAFYESAPFREMIEDMAGEIGVRVIGPSMDAFRYIYSKEKIENLGDMKSMKIRVPDVPLYVSTFEALGCAPTPISFSEMYTSLQTGVVDGLENSNNTVYTSALYEQVKYAAKTGHIFCDMSLMINESVYQGMEEEARTIVAQCAEKAAQNHYQRAIEADSEYEKLLEEEGMEFADVDKEEFREACQGVWKEYTDNVEGGQELIDCIQSLTE